MAKQPTEGSVKTRLCPPLTHKEAMFLYEAFLGDTIEMVAEACRISGDVTPALAYAPLDAHNYFKAILPGNFVLLPQVGADLGERLGNLPIQAQEVGYDTFAMISSDSPTLPPAIPADCFSLLRKPEIDVVLGSCDDGGYYLIGMKAHQPELFTGIAWSTSSVTNETLAAAAHAGLTVASLPIWYDADTVKDLGRIWADIEGHAERAPRTRAALADILPRRKLEIDNIS